MVPAFDAGTKFYGRILVLPFRRAPIYSAGDFRAVFFSGRAQGLGRGSNRPKAVLQRLTAAFPS
jgi:hypothetical protein